MRHLRIGWIVACAACLTAAGPAPGQDQPPPAQEERPAAEAAPRPEPTSEALTVQRVANLLKAHTPAVVIARMVEAQKATFDLTVEDVVRLRRLGATPELIQAMSGGRIARSETAEPPVATPEPGGSMSLRQAMRLYRKAVPPEEIAAAIGRDGVREPPTLEELLDHREQGVPPMILKALARGRVDAASEGPPAAEPTAAGSGSTEGQGQARAASPGLSDPEPGLPLAASIPAPASAPPDASTPAAPGATPDRPPVGPVHAEGVEAIAAGATAGNPGGRRRWFSRAGRPMDAGAIRTMLEKGEESGSIASAIAERGLTAPLSLDEVLALRAAGADDEVIAALGAASIAGAGEARADAEESIHVPTSEESDRLWVASIPAGARVFVSPRGARRQDAIKHDNFVGRTPLSLPLDAGEYTVVVQKEAGAFDEELLPAWRTVHDDPESRSVLDDAVLVFDPQACCLPGSLDGDVNVHPVPRDQSRSVIGDEFGGLPPYLFDGEDVQLLDVRRARIRSIMKLYTLKKNPGQSRLLVAAFIHSEGDPLDLDTITGLPPGAPYREYLEGEGLSFLKSPDGVASLAGALGVQADDLSTAVAMLRRAGKSILHQPVEGGFRFLSLALEDGGRLRVTDRTIRPEDPFAPPPPPPSKKRKAKPLPPPPAPPPLPAMERVVSPGQGLPRLEIDNTTDQAVGLLFDDGQFCWTPPRSRAEFSIDPGTHDVRALAPPGAPPGPAGQLHFAYHARYRMVFRPGAAATASK